MAVIDVLGIGGDYKGISTVIVYGGAVTATGARYCIGVDSITG